MAQKTVNFRMDDKLKTDADKLFSELGMNLSTAITIFVKKAVREQRIPFDVAMSDDVFFNPYNQERLLHSISQLRNGNTKVRDIMEDENNEDSSMD